MPGLPANAVKLYLYILYASEHNIDCDENTLAAILNCDDCVVKENMIVLESNGLIAIENDTVIIMDIIQKEIERINSEIDFSNNSFKFTYSTFFCIVSNNIC